MASSNSNSAPKDASHQLSDIQLKIDELMDVLAKLKDENRSLRQQQSQLMSERAGLIEKNDMARSRVEAIISRLKSLEGSK